MTEELNEVIEACEKINEMLQEQLYDEKYGMEPWVGLEVQIGSEGHVVMFLGEYLYNSQNEEREWIEDQLYIPAKQKYVQSHYEPIELYLRKKIMELANNINKIKL